MVGRTAVFIIDNNQKVSLRELCRLCGISPARVLEFVEEGVIEPTNPNEGALRWRFPITAVGRARVAAHLARDLGVNPPGAALAVDLLEQLRQMELRMRMLERHLFEL